MNTPTAVHRHLRRAWCWGAAGAGTCLLAWFCDARTAVPAGSSTWLMPPSPWSYSALAALALVFAAWPVAGLAGMQSRAREDSPIFVLRAVRTEGRRPRLSLYALDSPAFDRPLCTIPLLDTAGCPPPGVPFVVEVKGVPRPCARLAVAADGRLLWTTGRALHPAFRLPTALGGVGFEACLKRLPLK